jgi:NitT/TauT family transport system substrate-binding protein
MAQDRSLENTDMHVEMFVNHPQALALLLRGDADLLLSGTSQGWENRLDGSPIVMINTGVWGVASLVGRDRAIKGFGDLKGKKLALPFPGSPLDFQSRVLLAHEGISADRDLSISYGPFPQSVARLVSGLVDVAALPEPLATSAVDTYGLVRLIEYRSAWAAVNGGDGSSPQVSLFCTESFASVHRPLLLGFVEAWRKASGRVSADPDYTARAFAGALGLPDGVVEEATRRTLFDVPDSAENESRVMAYYRLVAPYLPGEKRQLDAQFFFTP